MAAPRPAPGRSLCAHALCVLSRRLTQRGGRRCASANCRGHVCCLSSLALKRRSQSSKNCTDALLTCQMRRRAPASCPPIPAGPRCHQRRQAGRAGPGRCVHPVGRAEVPASCFLVLTCNIQYTVLSCAPCTPHSSLLFCLPCTDAHILRLLAYCRAQNEACHGKPAISYKHRHDDMYQVALCARQVGCWTTFALAGLPRLARHVNTYFRTP